MRIGKLAHTLAKQYLNVKTRRRTIMLKGKSGIGKTEVLYQLAKILQDNISNWAGVVDIRLSQFDPVDFRGIPIVIEITVVDDVTGETRTEKRTVWAPPALFPKAGTSGIIFLDEITSAPPAVQAVAYQLCGERRVGDYELPDGWMVIAAGNFQSDRGVTFNLAGPLVNRMTEIKVATTYDDWRDHAMIVGKRAEIVNFVDSRKDYLHKFEGKGGETAPFPSPRAWFAVSDILDAEHDTEARTELICGTVGDEAGKDFEVYLRLHDQLPALKRIEEDPENCPIPEPMDHKYYTAMSICAHLSAANGASFWKYLKRMPKEFQTLTVKLAYRRDKEIAKGAWFGEWAAANADAFKRS